MEKSPHAQGSGPGWPNLGHCTGVLGEAFAWLRTQILSFHRCWVWENTDQVAPKRPKFRSWPAFLSQCYPCPTMGTQITNLFEHDFFYKLKAMPPVLSTSHAWYAFYKSTYYWLWFYLAEEPLDTLWSMGHCPLRSNSNTVSLEAVSRFPGRIPLHPVQSPSSSVAPLTHIISYSIQVCVSRTKVLKAQESYIFHFWVPNPELALQIVFAQEISGWTKVFSDSGFLWISFLTAGHHRCEERTHFRNLVKAGSGVPEGKYKAIMIGWE